MVISRGSWISTTQACTELRNIISERIFERMIQTLRTGTNSAKLFLDFVVGCDFNPREGKLILWDYLVRIAV